MSELRSVCQQPWLGPTVTQKELAVSSLAVAETIASTHDSRRDGQAELASMARTDLKHRPGFTKINTCRLKGGHQWRRAIGARGTAPRKKNV